MGLRSERGYRRKERNSYVRERRTVVLIAAEGSNKTETQYFRDFAREYNKTVVFAPGNYTDPVNMVVALFEDFRRRDLDLGAGDIGYCLVDADLNPSKDAQIAAADKFAAEHGLRVLVSNPCFEVWFLCHHSASARHFASNSAVLSELCRYYPGYTKSAAGMFSATQSKLPDAIKNAASLRAACESAGYVPHTAEFEPSTEIDELAERLSGIS